MDSFSDGVVPETVELSEAVLSQGREVFEEDYDGDIEAYMLVQDVRNRVEIATMDSGEMVYPEDLPGLDELGGVEAAEVFYSLGSQGYEKDDLPEGFFAEGLVEEESGDLFYGENAFPYLLVLGEAESIVEPEVVESGNSEEKDYLEAEVVDEGISDKEEVFETDAEVVESNSEEYSEDTGVEEPGSDETGGDKEESSEDISHEDKVDELSRIWDGILGSDD